MNFAKLYVSLNEKFEAVKFLQDRRYLLFKTRNCIHWNTEMTLYLGEKEDRFRCKNKKRWGTHRSMVDSYLCEFKWRQQNKEKGLFEEIFNNIVKYNHSC